MPESNDDVQDGLRKLLEKHSNDATALATQLYADNYELRKDRRELRTKLEEAEKAKPAEGAVVLSKADVERWKAYQELGKVEELKAALAERDTLKGEVAQAQRGAAIRAAAEAEGFNADVLTELARENHAFVVKEITSDGKTIKQANIVVTVDGKATEKPLTEFADENWKSFLPALKPAEQQQQQRQSNSGTPYVPQKKGEPPAPPADEVDARLKARDEARKQNPNPLMPRVASA